MCERLSTSETAAQSDGRHVVCRDLEAGLEIGRDHEADGLVDICYDLSDKPLTRRSDRESASILRSPWWP